MVTKLKVYHLNPKVEGRPKIDLIGVDHGGPLVKASASHVNYLSDFLGKYTGKLLVEANFADINVLGDDSVIPENHRKSAIPIEHEDILELAHAADSKITIETAKIEEKIRQRNPTEFDRKKKEWVKQLAEAYNRPDEIKELEIVRNPEKIAKRYSPDDPRFKYHGFIRNVRSVLMAGRLLKYSRELNEPIALVVGIGHVSQIHHFIERPDFAIRYLNAISRKFSPEESLVIQKHIDAAKKEFSLLLE